MRWPRRQVDRQVGRSEGNSRPAHQQASSQRFNCSRRTVLRIADDGLLTRRYLRSGNAKSLRFLEVEITALCGLPRKGEG
jgi:hypothetical protein